MERGNIAELRAKIKKSQDKKRYEHTLGVTYTAACLAMCYDIDTERAEIAGLLHDCAKCLSNDKKVSLLEKIVFIADYIEPGRNHSARLPELRRLAFQDLDKALVEILRDTLRYLKGTGNEIDPMTQKTYDYYKK